MYLSTQKTNHGEHGAHGELKDCSEELIYLKLLGFKRGYILNFKRRLLKEGIRRVSI